ncbi:hypothetical protein [Phycisphaera mikurensis]|uniref:Secreted protein n=1 Tax=Phycisphaera mikurensis (strain NBRC 102666 / KCTC 22515 / FYK2301M01) TaxID=1142394 RepID=I0ID45_PHYMF|nr:hypothetical protein [Phycisphaera mikurensis]MBB6442307.1 hypothetical protein [Phycisphaera mikurensis]BAM03183.1 hypothetical protein PSMK_10240 [Phycisphaera mikurensis NBRC 102666]
MSRRARLALAACAATLGCGPAAAQEEPPERLPTATGMAAVEPLHAATPQPLLRREGDFIVGRTARIVELADGALAAVFDRPDVVEERPLGEATGVDDEGFLAAPPPPEPAPLLPPMVLQPSRQLDALRAVRAGGEPDAAFALSGRVQRYRGRNHLLLTGFEGRMEAPEAAAAAGAPAAAAAAAAEFEDPATESVEALMADLDEAARPAAAGPRSPGPTPPAAASPSDAAGWRDGALVARRLGRVLPGSSGGSLAGSVFVFDGGDPPLRLLPCAATERAETLELGDGGGRVFELSGQVHVSGQDAWVLPASLRSRPAAGRVDEADY